MYRKSHKRKNFKGQAVIFKQASTPGVQALCRWGSFQVVGLIRLVCQKSDHSVLGRKIKPFAQVTFVDIHFPLNIVLIMEDPVGVFVYKLFISQVFLKYFFCLVYFQMLLSQSLYMACEGEQ